MSIQISDADLKLAQLPVLQIDGNGDIMNLSDYVGMVQVNGNPTLTAGAQTIIDQWCPIFESMMGCKSLF